MALESTYQHLLLQLPVRAVYDTHSPLLDMLKREQAEAKRKDDEYLAALSERERRIVLTQRRIETLERRYRNWWEENMAWRFRPNAPDHDCGW